MNKRYFLLVIFTIFLAACGGENTSQSISNIVTFELNLNKNSAFATQGLPQTVDKINANITGEIKVFEGTTEIFFDTNGNIATSNLSPLLISTLTGNTSLTLSLPVNTSYTFKFLGYEVGDNDKKNLAYGVLDTTITTTTTTLAIPLYTLLDKEKITLERRDGKDSDSIEANTFVEYYLTINASGRDDLFATIADFRAISYINTQGSIGFSSNVGAEYRIPLNVLPPCGEVTTDIGVKIEGFVDNNGVINKETFNSPVREVTIVYPEGTSPQICRPVTLNLDVLQPTIQTEIAADSSNTTIKIKGLVGDLHSGVSHIEVFDGVRKLQDAVIAFPENHDGRGPFEFYWQWNPDNFKVTRTLRFVAYDNANNISETEIIVAREVNSRYIALSGGANHTLYLRADGLVEAKGRNNAGQIDVPENLHNVIQISAGKFHSLALKNDGTVVAWGDNQQGQTNVPANLTNVQAISAGSYYSLALRNDGSVVVWGWGIDGLPSEFGSNVQAISAGFSHMLALKNDGSVVAYGNTTLPNNLTNIKAISAGERYSLALKNDGTVIGWGGSTAPKVPENLSNVADITAGLNHGIALKEDGSIVHWHTGTLLNRNFPSQLQEVTAISTNTNTGLALQEDGSVIAWGTEAQYLDIPSNLSNIEKMATHYNSHFIVGLYQEGTVSTWGKDYGGTSDVPSGLDNVVDIVTNGHVSLALRNDGTVVVWHDVFSSALDTLPQGLNNVIDIAIMPSFAVALKNDGTIVAWGLDAYNNDIQLNCPSDTLLQQIEVAGRQGSIIGLCQDGTVISHNYTLRSNLPQFRDIVTSGGFSIGITEEGTLMYLAEDTSTYPPIPTGLQDIKSVTIGAGNFLAVLSDDTLVAWGNNRDGQNNIPDGLSNVKSVVSGYSSTIAVKHDGTIAVWGWLGKSY